MTDASAHHPDAVPGGLRDGTRVAVRAGRPTPGEVAALVAAFDAAATGVRPEPPGPPVWLRAARLEGVGTGQLATPADLEQPGWARSGWR